MNKLTVIFEPDGTNTFQRKFTFTQEIDTDAHISEVHQFGKDIAKLMGFADPTIENWFGESGFEDPQEWRSLCSELPPLPQ